MSFSIHDLEGGEVTIEDVQDRSDREVGAGSRSGHMDFIRKSMARQIPNAEEMYAQKKDNDLKKYAMFGIVIYFLCC